MVATTAAAADGGNLSAFGWAAQQGFQALAQGRVAHAHGLQQCRALVRPHFKDGSQKHFFPILGRRHD
jgi:hypothetical protein